MGVIGMKFLKKLKVRHDFEYISTDRKSLFDSKYPGGVRICEHLKIDDKLSLSVQASESHYCTPRAYLPLEEYEDFELALIYMGELTEDMSLIKDFPKYDELMEYFNYGVFGFVPKDLIEDLYTYLLK